MDTTIIVSPRERFTSIIHSLESLFQTVPDNTPVVVVEGGTPDSIKRELEILRENRTFDWVSIDYFVTPQEARNIGFDKVKTKYVVFTDNDIHYQQGWLEALIQNAVDNDSDVVGPLICIGPPEASIIHHAGGEVGIKAGDMNKPHISDIHRLSDRPTSELSEDTAPVANGVVEFHCFLATADYIRKVGPMDERLVSREQVDFGLRAIIFDGKITFEKNAVVTYMAKIPFPEIDL